MKKKLKRICVLALLILFMPSVSFAQDEGLKFNEKGNFYGDLFLNSNYDVNKNVMSFRLNRLHFGYKYQFTEKLYFNGMIESAKEDYQPVGDYNNITNLFEFCLGFNLEKVEGKFGLIGTEINQAQEKLWKHRYVDKIFADKYGYAPTNDFGLILIYKPAEMLNIDFAITNGEGHKSFQADTAFRYATGITFKQSSGFMARLYADMLFYPDVKQTNLIGIFGYNSDKFSIAAEWNQQFNSYNLSDYERSGLSGYISADISKKQQVFARFDYSLSNQPNSSAIAWNVLNDGKLIIAGVQHKLHKKINLALDYRAWIAEPDESLHSYLFLDMEIAF